MIWINRRIIYQYLRFSRWKSSKRLSKKKELEKKSTTKNWRSVCEHLSFQYFSTTSIILRLLSKKFNVTCSRSFKKRFSWSKNQNTHNFFWSFKCSKIVTSIKKRRKEELFLRIEKNWKTYLKFIDVKKKIIVKKKKFRKIFKKFTI
jgi:hypothetical protein